MDQRGFVRKSIVRISFNWPNRDNKGKILTVVLPGTIVSIKDDGSCVVLADDTFFRQKNCPFVVNLPIAGGYDAVPVAPLMQFFVHGFCALVLQAQPNGYVQPVSFETGPVRREQEVYGFLFPQEDFFTPTMYCPGNVTDGGTGPLANWRHGIPFHSFGRFGSPIFNQSGHLVGISYQDYEAWSVKFLQQAVFREAEISRVCHGQVPARCWGESAHLYINGRSCARATNRCCSDAASYSWTGEEASYSGSPGLGAERVLEEDPGRERAEGPFGLILSSYRWVILPPRVC